MATPPEIPRAKVEEFLAKWKLASRSEEEQEELESLEVIREMLDRIKIKCPAAAVACDAELAWYERQLAGVLLEQATRMPEKFQPPRSDSSLMPDVDTKKE